MLKIKEIAAIFWILIFVNYSYADLGSCGKSNRALGAVLGGSSLSSSQRGNFPWVVALVSSKNQYFCGGVLISINAALTAAHCMQEKGDPTPKVPKDVKSLLGVFDLNDIYEIGRFSSATAKIRIHPEWNPDTLRYDADIALILMDQSAPLNNYIQPICLAKSGSRILSSADGRVIGYGVSSSQSRDAEKIPKLLKVPIHENEDCFLHNKEFAGISSKKTFCAGSGNGSNVCLGDSGSGLYVQDGDKQHLKGIVSSSLFPVDMTCNAHDYAIYTSVGDYYDWIIEAENRGYSGAEVCNSCEFSGPGKELACSRMCNICNGCVYNPSRRVEHCNGCSIYGLALIDECNGCSLTGRNGLARIGECNGCTIDWKAGPVWIKLCKSCYISNCDGCIKNVEFVGVDVHIIDECYGCFIEDCKGCLISKVINSY